MTSADHISVERNPRSFSLIDYGNVGEGVGGGGEADVHTGNRLKYFTIAFNVKSSGPFFSCNVRAVTIIY